MSSPSCATVTTPSNDASPKSCEATAFASAWNSSLRATTSVSLLT